MSDFKMPEIFIEAEELYSFTESEPVAIPAVQFVQNIAAAIEKIPESLRAGAFIKMWSSGEYVSTYVELCRPETLEEKQKRVADEAQRAKRYRDEMHDAEYRHYQRLRAKFH